MYRGRHQLGGEVPLAVECTDNSSTPVALTAAPTFDIYSASAKVIAGKSIPAMDLFGVTGLFQYRQRLDSRFAPGLYTVVYRWTAGSFNGTEIDTFEIVPGGHVDGTPIAMYFYRCPHADFIVQQLDSGKLVKGRNPTI